MSAVWREVLTIILRNYRASLGGLLQGLLEGRSLQVIVGRDTSSGGTGYSSRSCTDAHEERLLPQYTPCERFMHYISRIHP